MYLFGRITVTSQVPQKLVRLVDIAQNLWWSWNSEAIDLYREIDLPLWEKLGKNPVKFIQEVSQKKLEAMTRNESYMKRYQEVVERFDSYMGSQDSWFSRNFAGKKDTHIAYFSAEYGLNEVLPIYSGGLGVLSGDHCKAASDLGLSFAAVGLLYKQGYFSQHINIEGWQETKFTDLNISQLPVQPAIGPDGGEVYISVDFPGRTVFAKVWEVKVGKVSIYMIDTDVDKNAPADRMITARLYGGDQEMRICQEIFLGIGGIRALDALGIKPVVYHMNEGHSAFMGLELIRKLITEKGLSFKEAHEVVAASSVFTTHTPVPAGNDVFPYSLIDKYFSNYWASLGINRHEFIDLGTKVGDGNQNFNMTVLAMNLSGRRNGVSRLHGAVSRNIFNSVWPGVPEDEVPIGHITNGIHTLTWLSPTIKNLYNKSLGPDWIERISDREVWEDVDKIPASDLWQAHVELKKKMISYLRLKMKEQKRANGESLENINSVDGLLDPDALTIGFARRFATYKRANLIFRDIERIKKILDNKDMPVQIIFAGKAHPADKPAHEVIKNIHDIAKEEEFVGKVVLIENYNMTIARNMLQGVDVWLNNPRRPLEASGTSGQKAAINGVINCSILDGWWVEGYNGKNGWAIGDQVFYDNEASQDNADSQSLYKIIEEEIVPLYYTRDENGIPQGWISKMKESIKSLAPVYSTHRMVIDYTENMYLPSAERVAKVSSDDFAAAKDLASWKSYIVKGWPQVQIYADKSMGEFLSQKIVSGQAIPMSATVNLGSLSPKDVRVEAYFGKIGDENSLEDVEFTEMKMTEELGGSSYRYSAEITIFDGGEYGYTFRVYPHRPDLVDKFEMGLVKWVMQ